MPDIQSIDKHLTWPWSRALADVAGPCFRCAWRKEISEACGCNKNSRAWRKKNDEHTATTNKNQRSLTGHSLWFLHGHSGSLEVIRRHFGHSLHGGTSAHTLDENVHVSDLLGNSYTRRHTSTNVMACRTSHTRWQKVSPLNPL